MRNKVNALVAGAKNKAIAVLNRKDAGIETLMVIALVCVVAVALTAMFRTEAGTLIGSIFDIIGMAVASADEKPFHAMAARKVTGAKESIRLLRNAERVSSICNDVVGDICGVVSGSASATIAAQILRNFEFTWPQIISLLMSAMAAGLTVGGKAIGKTVAVKSCTSIVHTVGKGIHAMNRLTGKKKK